MVVQQDSIMGKNVFSMDTEIFYHNITGCVFLVKLDIVVLRVFMILTTKTSGRTRKYFGIRKWGLRIFDNPFSLHMATKFFLKF